MNTHVNIEDRAKTADLIRKVLTGQICVREALLAFPPDTEDKSILSCYHALVHFEADEDLRKRDNLYREEQDDYLELLSYIMERGEDLPDNIIKSYEKYYTSAPIPHTKDSKGFFKSFLRFLNVK